MFRILSKNNTEARRNDFLKKYDVVIHIGAPKTGSTALQRFLHANRRWLKKNGFYYPKHHINKIGITAGHSALTAALQRGTAEDAKSIYDSWKMQAQKRQLVLLLSSESFFSLAPKFKSIVTNERILVIGYQRDIVDHLVSAHNQLIKKNFETQPFEDYVLAFMDRSSKIPKMVRKPFSTVYGEWSELVGADNVLVRPYDAKHFYQNKIEFDFLHILHLSTNNVRITNTPINVSYPPHAAELKRLINHVLDPDAKKCNKQIDLLIQQYSDSSAAPREKIVALSADTYQKLNCYIQDDIEKLNTSYLEQSLEDKKVVPAQIHPDDSRMQLLMDSLLRHRQIRKYLHQRTRDRLNSGQDISDSIRQLAAYLKITAN